MKPLIVVDLDRTLLRVDSFRSLVLRHLDPVLLLLLLRRRAGGLDAAAFAEKAARHLAPLLEDPDKLDAYAAQLESYLDPVVMAMVRAQARGDALTLVLSASPEAYVARLAARLGFSGIGSHWRGDTYVHCHGSGKRQLLLERFPQEDFSYDFGMGDDESDRVWLCLFRRGLLYRRSIWGPKTVAVSAGEMS